MNFIFHHQIISYKINHPNFFFVIFFLKNFQIFDRLHHLLDEIYQVMVMINVYLSFDDFQEFDFHILHIFR